MVKHVLTLIMVGIPFALGGMSMVRIAARLGASTRMALVSTLAVAMGTMLWPYSVVYYGHVVAAAFLIIAFDMLHAFRVSPASHPGRRFFLAGLAMGLAFLTEYPTAFIILGLLSYATYILMGRLQAFIRCAALAALGALFPLALMAGYNMAVFGTPVAFGYTHEYNPRLAAGISSGVLGFNLPDPGALYHTTLDPKFGLLWLSPVLLLIPIGFARAVKMRAHRAEVHLSLYAISAMLLMNASYYFWWGGAAFGPRLIIPALPFMVVPLALLPGMFELPAMVLGALSTAQMLIPLMSTVQPPVGFTPHLGTFTVEALPFRGFSLLYQYLLPLILRNHQAGTAAWTLAAALHFPYSLTIPLLVAIEALLIAFYQVPRLNFKRVASSAAKDTPPGA